MLSYSEFKKNKAEKELNEGIIGNVLGALKDKFALSISKKIGGAKKVDQLIDQRKIELKDILNQKLKLEEELLLAKNAFDKSDGDDSLRTQYEQKKIAVRGQMAGINKKGLASQKKFSLQLNQLKKKGGVITSYAELQEINMQMELSDIEIAAYKKMGRNTSKLEAKLKTQSDSITAKKEEIKKALQKKSEEAKDITTIEKGVVYDYLNSKGAQLSVKVLDNNKDADGFIKVVNAEKEGKSDGFRVKPEDLKSKEGAAEKEVKQAEKEAA